MRHVLVSLTTLALLLVSGSALLAQEASPEPSPAVSPEPLEVEAATQPLPVADYWGAWNPHKRAFRYRLRIGVQNARNARSKRVGFYRALVGVHNDESLWLDRHQPEDCYTAEYERWRAAVEELRALEKKAVGLVRKGDASGLKGVAKQRRAATKDLDKLLTDVAGCPDSVPPTVVGDPFVGKWLSRPVYVLPGTGVDRNPRRLTISDSGRLLLRIPRHPYCREMGHGLVPFVLQARGETVIGAAVTPTFQSVDGTVACHRKGRAPAVTIRDSSGVWDYDPTTDVILNDSECYWRTRGGSPTDCTRFWRGERPAVPAMVGLGAKAATRALRQAGLAGVPKEVVSETVPAGVVVSQALAPGTPVDKGRNIVYSVSVGPEVDAEGNGSEA